MYNVLKFCDIFYKCTFIWFICNNVSSASKLGVAGYIDCYGPNLKYGLLKCYIIANSMKRFIDIVSDYYYETVF